MPPHRNSIPGTSRPHRVKGVPIQAWTGSYGSSRLRLTGFADNRHMHVAGLSFLRYGSLYPQGDILLEAESTPAIVLLEG